MVCGFWGLGGRGWPADQPAALVDSQTVLQAGLVVTHSVGGQPGTGADTHVCYCCCCWWWVCCLSCPPPSLASKISKKVAQLQKAELAAAVKEDLKTVALGTSKINYMDPRITIAWCKRNEVGVVGCVCAFWGGGGNGALLVSVRICCGTFGHTWAVQQPEPCCYSHPLSVLLLLLSHHTTTGAH